MINQKSIKTISMPSLTVDQMTVIEALQNFYQTYHVHPSMRIFIKQLEKIWSKEKANSRYLYQLFPKGPIQQASALGGLPKPDKCL